jgi:hypothetical protein
VRKAPEPPAAEEVHFFSLVLSRAVCWPPPQSPPARTSVDPAKVTCPKCRRFLAGEATGQWSL